MEKVLRFTKFPNLLVFTVSILLLSNPLSVNQVNAQSSTSITDQYGLSGKEPNLALWYQTIKDTFKIGDARRPEGFGRPTPVTDKYGSDTKLWYEEMKKAYLASR